jgi:hypothetical protein
MKSSTKFVLLALAAAGLSGAMTAPTSAQVFKPRGDQTCDNPSTARDKSLKPETRCLRPKSGPAFERWMNQQIAGGNPKASQPLVPGGPPRRDYDAPNGGVPYPAPSKGKKPR